MSSNSKAMPAKILLIPILLSALIFDFANATCRSLTVSRPPDQQISAV
jgi:hypothetical protein